MMNFEHTVKRRFKIVDFSVDEYNDIYINDILFKPVSKKATVPTELYNTFFAGGEIKVNYYCPTDGRNLPKSFSIRYIEDSNFVEVIKE